MKQTKIPTIIAVVTLILGLAAGVFLVSNQQIFKLGASSQNMPKNVRVTNINDSSFTVSWTTDKENKGFIVWGESPSTIDRVTEEDSQVSSLIHSALVSDLTPDTAYYFKINSGGGEFDNNKIPWQVNTGPKIQNIPDSISISGTILKTDLTPLENAIVYINIAGASPLSTTTNKNGNWVIPLSLARTVSLDSYVSIDRLSTDIELTVQAGKLGSASAIFYPANAQPMPQLTLGKTLDLRSKTQTESGMVPSANIDAPADSGKQSKFLILPEESSSPLPESSATIESVSNGETIYTNRPEFFGKGPKGTNITITVESETVTASVKADSQGMWKWTPPKVLEEGSHTVTLSWKENNVLKSITRTFNVQAASMNPSFESTPSATKSPSPTPTQRAISSSTPTPKTTSTPSPRPTTTITPEESVTPTRPPIPESGVLTPTLILFIMGIGSLLSSGLVIFNLSQKK